MDIDTTFIDIFLSKINRKVHDGFDFILNKYGLSKVHFHYIVKLHKNKEGLTLVELTSSLHRDKSNTTRVINDLYEKGYVDKDYKNGLKFKYKVFLTESGMKIGDELKLQGSELDRLIREKLSAEDLKNLKDILIKLTEDF